MTIKTSNAWAHSGTGTWAHSGTDAGARHKAGSVTYVRVRALAPFAPRTHLRTTLRPRKFYPKQAGIGVSNPRRHDERALAPSRTHLRPHNADPYTHGGTDAGARHKAGTGIRNPRYHYGRAGAWAVFCVLVLCVLFLSVLGGVPVLEDAARADSITNGTHITVTKLTGGNYHNDMQGIYYHIAVSYNTVELLYTFDPEYKDELTGELEEFTSPEDDPIADKEVVWIASENGKLILRATLDLGEGQEDDSRYLVDYAYVEVTSIDYIPPQYDVESEMLSFTGGYVSGYSVWVTDYFLRAKQCALSGIEELAVYRRADNLAATEWWDFDSLPSSAKLDAVEGLERVFYKDRVSSAVGNAIASYEVSFPVARSGGGYYIFTKDRAGKTNFDLLFELSDRTVYMYAGEDVSDILNDSMTLAANGKGKFRQSILDELESAVNAFRFILQRDNVEEDDVNAAYTRYKNARKAYNDANTAGVTFQLNVDADSLSIYPGTVRTEGLDAEAVPAALKGDVVEVTVSIVEYPKPTDQREHLLDAAGGVHNRTFKIKCNVTVNGSPASLSETSFKLVLTVPDSFRDYVLIKESGDAYQSVSYLQGAAWFQFTAPSDTFEYYLIAQDGMSWRAWLAIGLGIAGGVATLILIICIVQVKKKKDAAIAAENGGAAPKKAGTPKEEDDDLDLPVERPKKPAKPASNKSKKKKR